MAGQVRVATAHAADREQQPGRSVGLFARLLLLVGAGAGIALEQCRREGMRELGAPGPRHLDEAPGQLLAVIGSCRGCGQDGGLLRGIRTRRLQALG